MATLGSWAAAGSPAPLPPAAGRGAAAGRHADDPGVDAWAAWAPGQDTSAAGSQPGDDRIMCSAHNRSRSRRNLIPDGRGGFCCFGEPGCLGGVADGSKAACPRDAASGRRVDAQASGGLHAPPPPL